MTLMNDPHWVRTFMLAGNARITILSKKTGQRYTYRIAQATDKEKDKPIEGMFFVSFLTGANNEDDYTYLGIIRNNLFKATKATRNPESTPFRAFDWFWRQLVERNQIRSDLEVRHEGRCGRCNRALTTPQSIDRGIGPECWEKMGLDGLDTPVSDFGHMAAG